MRVIYLLLTIVWLSAPALQAQPRPAQSAAGLLVPDTVTRSVAQLSSYLADHTTSSRDFVKQLYTWITAHIAYDVANMYKPDYYRDTADAAVKTLQTRQGVCQGYASLYYLVCKKAGIPVYLVSGYTKTNGQLDNSSHAWVAVNIDHTWYLTDPTWGAGGIDKGKFVRKANWSYFLVQPEAFVKTHMPFDPLWQMLEYPCRHEEFRDNNWLAAAKRPAFHYRDTLAQYNSQDELSRYQQAAYRIEQCGIANQFTGVELQHLRNAVAVLLQNRAVEAQNRMVNRYNSSGSYYNQAINLFNAYVQYKNAQFKPSRPDQEIKDMVDSIAGRMQLSRQELSGVNTTDASLQRNIQGLQQSLADLEKRVNEETAFVAKYMKTGKLFRKSLFYKTTWFGVPVN